MSREITLSNTQLTVDGDITVRGTMSATNIVGSAAGLQGTTGTQGVQGLTGSGTQGTQGITGIQGVSGVNGTDGTDGTDGLQGTAGLAGTNGLNGTNGSNGVNTAVVYAYKWGTAVATDQPNTDRTYTFDGATWNNISGGNGWTLGQIPTKGDNTVLSVCVAVASSTSSTDVVAASDWGSPQILTQDGADGTSGTNTAVVYAYKRSSSTLASDDKPSTTRTWTFSTATFNNNDLGDSWSGTIPTGTDNLYFCAAVASSLNATDDIVAADWTSPQLFSSNGTDAINSAVVYAYKWGTAVASDTPITSRTYTFATTSWSSTDGGNGWTLGQIPTKSSNNVLSVCVAIASGTGATDTVVEADWSAAQILTQDGTNGIDGTDGTDGTNGTNTATVYAYKRSASALISTDKPSTTRTWTFSSGTWNNNDLGSSWSGVNPAGTDDLYFCVAVASSDNATDDVITADWTAPQLFASNGTDGTDGTDGADGVNTAVLYAYKWGTAVATNKPSITRTYTFATTAWSSTDGGNGWTLSNVPTKGANTVLSICTGIASGTGATDSVTADDWSSPQILAQDGVNGTDGDDGGTGPRRANGFIYRYASAAGTAPTGGSITWSTGVLTPPTGWSNNDPGTPSTGESLYVSYWSAAEDTFGGTTTITYTTPVLGVTNVNDVRSINYDGPTTPIPSDFGTTGYYLDASAGNAVFNNIFLRDNIITADAIATGIVAQQSNASANWTDAAGNTVVLSVSVVADTLSSLVVWLVGRTPYQNTDDDGNYPGYYGLVTAPTGVSTSTRPVSIQEPVSDVILITNPAAGTYGFGFGKANVSSDVGNNGYLNIVAIGFK